MIIQRLNNIIYATDLEFILIIVDGYYIEIEFIPLLVDVGHLILDQLLSGRFLGDFHQQVLFREDVKSDQIVD